MFDSYNWLSMKFKVSPQMTSTLTNKSEKKLLFYSLGGTIHEIKSIMARNESIFREAAKSISPRLIHIHCIRENEMCQL